MNRRALIGSPHGENMPPNDEIWYTTSDEQIQTPYVTHYFDANIISNTYSEGKGIIKFDGDLHYFCYNSFSNVSGWWTSRLLSILIPESIINIQYSAFEGCPNITSIIIPYAVTTIGQRVFNNCTSLTYVYVYPITPPSLGTNAFNNNNTGRKIYVPAQSLEAYKNAEGWNTYADDIVAMP